MVETIRQSEWIRVRYKGKMQQVQMSDVEYIEAEEWLSKLNTADDTIIFAQRLGDLCSQLAGFGFVRCHKGFVVNMNKIKRLKAAEITLVSGKRIPVGRVYKKDMTAAYQQFITTTAAKAG